MVDLLHVVPSKTCINLKTLSSASPQGTRAAYRTKCAHLTIMHLICRSSWVRHQEKILWNQIYNNVQHYKYLKVIRVFQLTSVPRSSDNLGTTGVSLNLSSGPSLGLPCNHGRHNQYVSLVSVYYWYTGLSIILLSIFGQQEQDRLNSCV